MKSKYHAFLRASCLCLSIVFLICSGCSKSNGVPDKEGADAPSDKGTLARPLVPRPLPRNDVAPNPYMAARDSAVHNDSYSSDVTDAVTPLGIDPQIHASAETMNKQTPATAFYDDEQYAVTPFLEGTAIARMDGDTVTRQGSFIPSRDDTEPYSIQISYSFVDNNDHIVAPTSHGHIIVLNTKDASGEILPTFEKIMDVDVVGAAKEALGEDIDQNLLSIVYDYEGNLWFVTGGFRIYPDRNPAGFMGYLSPEGELFFHRLSDGECAENGISANEDGAVILTNKACYMLNAHDGVNIKWERSYKSNGANDAKKDSDYTGGGLAWGSGSTPTLTKDLVLFTDNLDPVNLIALSSKTGEVVAETPVLEKLPEDTPVSVENSILVYSADKSRTSVLVCNWFGAGNPKLADPENDSSVQSSAAVYDPNWIAKGNDYIAPGVERVDIVKDKDAYDVEKTWFRDDIRDTSMIKLSTSTGYLYGYWQDPDSKMWTYEVLDFDTGETLWEVPVSKLATYNNLALGMTADVRGNALYTPTNNMVIVRLQDAFVYLPDSPVTRINPDNMERYHLSESRFQELSQTKLKPATYLMKAAASGVPENITAAFKTNGLSKSVSDYTLFTESENGQLTEVPEAQWHLADSEGKELPSGAKLTEENIYEVWVEAETKDNILKTSAILAF